MNVAEQTDDPDSLLSHYRELIHLRSAHPALQTGTYTLVESGSRAVYSFLRQSEGETLLVLINLSKNPVSEYGLSLSASFSGAQAALVAGDGTLAQPGDSTYVPLAELAPYSLTVIQISP